MVFIGWTSINAGASVHHNEITREPGQDCGLLGVIHFFIRKTKAGQIN